MVAVGDRAKLGLKNANELLEEFRLTGRQEAFEEIVRRYGGMVFHVCYRVTRNAQDAEDATQAVFLALALQTREDKEVRAIGPWLQQVAHRVSLDIRKSKKRRSARELKHYNLKLARGNGHTNGNGHAIHPADETGPDLDALRPILTEEIGKLPARYRLPLVMHYFGGMNREELARELNCKPSTLGVRIHRGRAMLGNRLKERGVTLASGMLAVALTYTIQSNVSANLIQTTTAAAAQLALREAVLGHGVPAHVMAAAGQVPQLLATSKIKAIAAAVLLAATAFGGTTTLVQQVRHGGFRFDLTSRVADWFRPLLRSITPVPTLSELPSLAPHEIAPDPLEHMRPVNAWAVGVSAAPSLTVLPAVPTEDGEYSPTGGLAVVWDGVPTSLQAEQASSTAVSSRFAGSVVSWHRPDPLFAGHWTGRSDSPAPSHAMGTTPHTGAAPSTVVARTIDTLTLGTTSPNAGIERFDLRRGETLSNATVTVGQTSRAILTNSGGRHEVLGALVLGASGGGHGTYRLEGEGELRAGQVVVGAAGTGVFIQSGGTVGAESIALAADVGSKGHYEIAAGELTTSTLQVGIAGAGSFVQTGGTVAVAASFQQEPVVTRPLSIAAEGGTLDIGVGVTGEGSYTLADGLLVTPAVRIGIEGKGTFTQSGGTSQTQKVVLGVSSTGQGSLNLVGGDLQLRPDLQTGPRTVVVVGDHGRGVLNLGGEGGVGLISQATPGTRADVIIRDSDTGSGVLRGWGKVHVTGLFEQNGMVIADGYGADRTLDLSSVAAVYSEIENVGDEDTNGWFARTGGRLLLPAIDVHEGSGVYTWGEDATDPLPDLVNSIRVGLHDVPLSTRLQIALLSPDRRDVPLLPDGHDAVGIWSFDGLPGGAAETLLTIRYDDRLISELGHWEAHLTAWVFTSGQWQLLPQDAVALHSSLNLITLRPDSGFSHVALLVPEPGLGLLGLAAAGGLLRRRRA
jgi:RNA polymerase sigma factor (sigma-70 family)